MTRATQQPTSVVTTVMFGVLVIWQALECTVHLILAITLQVFHILETFRQQAHREKEYDRFGLEDNYIEFLGNKVVCHSIPIRPGRNIAIIVQSAAVNHRQKLMGYNAAQELYNRVTKNLISGSPDNSKK